MPNFDRNTPFEHYGRHGTSIRGKCDLTAEMVTILPGPNSTDSVKFAEDIAEIIGWWSANILPEMLKDGLGFAGFDVIKFRMARSRG